MSINFSVETGTAASNSTSYATCAQYKQYCEDRGTAVTDSDTIIQGLLNQATEFIDFKYKFFGSIVKSDQALQWPRGGVYNSKGIEILYTAIPAELINATCYLAGEAKNNKLNRLDEGISSYSYGPVSKTFKFTSDSVEYPVIDKYLKSFILSGTQMVRVN